MSNTQVSTQMVCLVTTDNNQLIMSQNTVIENQPLSLTNCNMMNINKRYHLLAPHNMFSCPMIPIGYNPFNQINHSNLESNTVLRLIIGYYLWIKKVHKGIQH